MKKITIIFISVFILLPQLANAQANQPVPMKPRTSPAAGNQTIYNIKGDFTMIGNTNVTLVTYGDNTNNNSANMRYVNIDNTLYPDLLNSSSATLRFSTDGGAANPNCSQVLFAGLYWTGRPYVSGSPNNSQTLTIKKQVPADAPVYIDSTILQLRNGVPVPPSPFSMTVTVEGGNPRTVYYHFGTGNTAIVFRFNPSGATPISVSTTGRNGTFTTIPGQTAMSPQPANSIGYNFTPYTFSYQGLSWTVSALLKHSSGNNTDVNFPYAKVYVSGSYLGMVDVITAYRKDIVKLRHESDDHYHEIQASSNNFTQNILYPLNGSSSDIYVAYADITEYVQSNGEGAYYVADMALNQGMGDAMGIFGGWGLVVIYENDLMKWRNITVFDGFGYISTGNPNYGDLTLSGFNAVQQGPVGIKLGVMAGEGDVGMTGDRLGIRQLNSTAFTYLSHPNNVNTNFFNSSIYSFVNGVQSPRNPNLKNNTGIDIAMMEVPNATKQHITNNQTSTTFRYETGGDMYVIFNLTISIDAYVPEPVTENVIYALEDKAGNPILPDAEGNYTVHPGDKIQYALQVKNRGTEGINNMKIELPIPYTTEFVSAIAIPYNGFVTQQPVYDNSDGATGFIRWNVGNVPVPENPDHVFAELLFELKVTEDCDVLVGGGSCDPTVIIDGTVSGVGAITGIEFDGMRFVYGYQEGECVNVPLHTPPAIKILAASECGEATESRTISVCLPSSATTVPYEAIAQHFQKGARFYDIINLETGKPIATSVEYTQATNFPTTKGATYYAVPASLSTTCFWVFTIDVLPVPSFEFVSEGAICVGDSINLKTLISNIQPENSALHFYSNSAATMLIDSIVKPATNTTYYARTQTSMGYGCISSVIPISVFVKNSATASMIIADDLTLCSENEVILYASANTAITNPQFTWYSSQTSTEPLEFGAQFNAGVIEVSTNKDTVFYVSVTGDNYCENITGNRKAVTVKLYPLPTLTLTTNRNYLCGYQNFEIFPEFEVGSDLSVISYYQWSWKDLATNNFQPASGSPSGTIAKEYFGNIIENEYIYTPSDKDFDMDSVVLMLEVVTMCGVATDVIILYTGVGAPDAIMEIVEQPREPQYPCVDTCYVIKITENGQGGLTDIVVAFNDWKSTLINVIKAEYLFPIEGENPEDRWKEMELNKAMMYFSAAIPEEDEIVLQTGESMLVRFTVTPDCGFFAGADFLFELYAKDECKSRNMPVKNEVSDIFLMFGDEAIASYSLTSSFSNYHITNEGGGNTTSRTITWSVEYVYDSDGNPAPNFDTDAIYFNIPTGFTLIENSLKSTDGSGFYETVTPIETGYDDPTEKEYKIPLIDGLENFTPQDTVKFELQFMADEDVDCGNYLFYIEIIHEEELTCEKEGETPENCTFYETMTGSYQEITVDLYSFVPIYEEGETYHGIMENNMWGGTIRSITQTDIFAGDEITIVFYADMNNNGIIDAGDIQIGMIPFPTENLNALDTAYLYFGQTLSLSPLIEIPWINTEDGKQLIGLATGKHTCDDVIFPIATIFGPQTVCEGDTALFYAPDGMWNYLFNYQSTDGGVAPIRIPLEGNSIFSPNDHEMRLIFKTTGKYAVSIRYMLPDENVLLNMTLMNVEVSERPVLGYTQDADTTICQGEQVELTHFFTVTNEIDEVTYQYFKKETDDSYTELFEDFEGLVFVTPDETTEYRVIAINTFGECETVLPLDFTVIVNNRVEVTITQINSDCGADKGSIELEVSKGSGNYLYSIDDEENYYPLPSTGIISELGAGNYTLYIKDAENSACPATVSSSPIEIRPEQVIAKNDTVYTFRGQPVGGNVLNNDFDMWGQPLEMVDRIDYPKNGKIEFVSFYTGDFVYTPNLTFVGMDSVIYEIVNPCGLTDSAWLFIIVDATCPDSAKIYKTEAFICPDETVDLQDLILPTSEFIETIYFYSDRYYTDELTNTIVSDAGYYYVRAFNMYGCSTDDSLKVNLLPNATEIEIIADDVKVCSGITETYITITATAPGVVNPVFYYYISQTETTPEQSNTTGIFNITGPVLPTNYSFICYIAVEGEHYCENLPETRKEIKVEVYPVPTLSIASPHPNLCGESYFTINATINAGTDLTGMTYFWERQELPGTTFSAPTGLSPDIAGDILFSSKTFTYTPNAEDRANGEIILKVTANSPVCGAVEKTITLYIDAQAPDATFEMVEQPTGLQTPCVETAYVLKVTDAGTGGISDISVTMNDWKGSDIKVIKVEYEYPISSGVWEEVSVIETGLKFTANLPSDIVLENGDALLVRFTVTTECEFYGGADYLFSLNAKDACHNFALDTKYETSDPFQLDWTALHPNQFWLNSEFDKYVIQNSGGGSLASRTVTWSVEYVYYDAPTLPDYNKDSIYFNIPYGMSLVSVNGKGLSQVFYNNTTPNLVTYDPLEGAMYRLPLYDQLHTLSDEDTVKFDIIFEIEDDVDCDDFWFYVEIIHGDNLMCNATVCKYYETLSGSYQDLSVQLYDFEPYLETSNNEYFGEMDGNFWSGKYRMRTLTDLYVGDYVEIKFYADMNNNGFVDAGDQLMKTINYPIVANVSANELIVVDVNDIPVMDGKQLLALGSGPFICEEIVMPLVTLFGNPTVCQGDTMVYYTAAGMANYQFSVERISGSTILPTRIPLEGETLFTSNDDAARFVFSQPGVYSISARYQITSGLLAGQMLNRTLMTVEVTARPNLEYTADSDTTVCQGTPVELSHFFKEENGNAATFYYERKEADATWSPIGNGAPFFVSPWDTTTYRVSAKENHNNCPSLDFIEFTINTYPQIRLGSIWLENPPTCSNTDGMVALNVFGGSGSYSYSINNEDYYQPLDITDGNALLADLPVGEYVFYVKDNLGDCPAAVSEPILLRPHDSQLSVTAEVEDATNCGSNDGKVTLTVYDGEGVIQYSTDGGATYKPLPTSGLLPETFAPGHYTFFVKDESGCESPTWNVTIEAKSGLNLTLSQIAAADCEELGTVSIVVSGGTPPYHYKVSGYGWMPMQGNTAQTQVNAGIRYISVKDAAGCEISRSINIDNPTSNFSITKVETTNATCGSFNNGTITITISNPSAKPLYISFDDNRENAIPVDANPIFFPYFAVGTYQITVFDDAGCKVLAEKATILKDNGFLLNLNDYEMCDGDSVNLNTLIKNSTYVIDYLEFYADSDYLIPLPTDYAYTEGYYYVRAYSKDGCITENSLYVSVHSLPATPVIVKSPLSVFPGNQIDLALAVDLISGMTYTYYLNSDKTGVLTSSLVTFEPPKNDYYVSVNDGVCESEVSKILLGPPCPPTIDDVEGNTYKVTALAGLCWTENLYSKIYSCSGEPIPFAKPYTCIGCPQQLDTIFGLLYDWYSAMGMENPDDLPNPNCICPDGWHLPSQAEWDLLKAFPASQLQSTNYWLDPPGSGTDNYGFDARPAGWYNGKTQRCEDLYGFAGWWASDADPASNKASYFYITYYCNVIEKSVKNKDDGLSVRCVKEF